MNNYDRTRPTPKVSALLANLSCIVQQGEVSYYACQAEPVDLPFITHMSQEGRKVIGNFPCLLRQMRKQNATEK